MKTKKYIYIKSLPCDYLPLNNLIFKINMIKKKKKKQTHNANDLTRK